MKLDKTDRKILRELQKNARININDLAETIGLSATPCSRRIKRLEDDGFISRYTTILDAATLKLDLTVIVGITMDRHTPDRFDNFESLIKSFPEVIECSIVTGQSADYLVKVVVPDMKYYEEFLLGKLTRIDGVTGVHSSFILREVVKRTELPLDHYPQ